jgi:hypothetical protein
MDGPASFAQTTALRDDVRGPLRIVERRQATWGWCEARQTSAAFAIGGEM